MSFFKILKMSDDNCFKCGKSGHWARNCSEGGGMYRRGRGGYRGGRGGGRGGGNFIRKIHISINIVFLVCSLFSRIYVHVERLYLTLVGTYVTACLQKLYSK